MNSRPRVQDQSSSTSFGKLTFDPDETAKIASTLQLRLGPEYAATRTGPGNSTLELFTYFIFVVYLEFSMNTIISFAKIFPLISYYNIDNIMYK